MEHNRPLTLRRGFLRAPIFVPAFIDHPLSEKEELTLSSLSIGGAFILGPTHLEIGQEASLFFPLPQLEAVDIDNLKSISWSQQDGICLCLRARVMRQEIHLESGWQGQGLAWVDLPREQELVISSYVQTAAAHLSRGLRDIEKMIHREKKRHLCQLLSRLYALDKIYPQVDLEIAITKAYRNLEDQN